jgi:S1-C subfamily serine protease
MYDHQPAQRSTRLVLLAALFSALAAALAVSAIFLAAGAFDEDDRESSAAAAPASAARAGTAALIERGRGGVVLVEARPRGTPLAFGRPSRDDGVATGTGFVIDDAGHVVTNDHVVARGRVVTVQTAPRAARVRARIVGRDPSTDLALLRVEPREAPEVVPLPLGDSDDVRVGDPAIAIGNPYGLQQTVTVGVVSATERTIDAPDGFPIEGAVQTDAAINSGNSGGPLLDAAGRVIGVNSQSEPDTTGISYAIPVDTLKRVLPELRREGRVERAYLGVATLDLEPDLARTLGLDVSRGLVVTEVTPDSPAGEAGVRAADSLDRGTPRGGDVLLAIDGARLAQSADLTAQLERLAPGQEVELTLLRDGRRTTVTVELGRRGTR